MTVKTMREIADSIGAKGCSSSICVFGAPRVHTNGGCACLRDVRDVHARAVIRDLTKLARTLDTLRKDGAR
jgi:hypothetical protein